ncbi:MAG: lysE type translocator family protein [Hyphomicrobiales bacterium]|jgi:threonine/homoserine/homoserine lactone efflux protein|nr:lysE type translocator family protein [Hyphomicrobiales bacterium]
MSPESLAAVAAFCFAGSMTPGPNNLMLLASGVNFGFRRTLPHMAGVLVGYSFLLAVMGVGLGGVFTRLPWAYGALKIAGAVYLLWLAWKVATSGPAGEGGQMGAPMTFWQAAAFQWINAKGVLLAISAVAAFTRPEAFALTLGVLVGVATLASVASTATWTLFGSGLRKLLRDPRAVRPFNWTMAALLAASLWPMLAEP